MNKAIHHADDETLHYIGDLEREIAKLREELAEKDETITALRMGWTECSESNKDVEAALEGFSYSGSYADGVRKLREEHDAALRLAYARAATAEQRAEAAEARIKEAEGQEPVAWFAYTKSPMGKIHDTKEISWFRRTLENPSAHTEPQPLYTRPIPPADVAELQAKYALLHQVLGDAAKLNNAQVQRIAELEREVTRLSGSSGYCAECERLSRKLAEVQRGKTWDAAFEAGLAKARAEAVPEGLTDVLREAGDVLEVVATMQFHPDLLRLPLVLPLVDELRGFAAMLAAAPNP